MARSVEIVTVTFAGEIGLLRLQARSIARHVDPHLVPRITLVLNDPAADALTRAIETTVLAEFGVFADRVRIVAGPSLLQTSEAPGWRTQQSLKLLMHERVETDTYLILDTKNHFIRGVGADQLFAPDRRMLSHVAPARGDLHKFFGPSFAAFGLSGETYAPVAMPATTPYLVRRDLVARTISMLEERHGMSFATFFHVKHRNTTEFYLYNAAIEALGLREQMYAFGPPGGVALFAVYPETDEKFAFVMRKAKEPTTISFGLHRNRIPALTPAQWQQVIDLWVTAGLVADRQDAVQLLDLTLQDAA